MLNLVDETCCTETFSATHTGLSAAVLHPTHPPLRTPLQQTLSHPTPKLRQTNDITFSQMLQQRMMLRLKRMSRSAEHLVCCVPLCLFIIAADHRSLPAHVKTIQAVAEALHQPRLVELLRQYLQVRYDPDGPDPDDIPVENCPYVWQWDSISVYHCASAAFYAPSEQCGPYGMHREMIRATPLWWGEFARYDTVLVNIDEV